MLPIDLSSLRLFLHVLAASVWVGGQIAVAGLLPTARSMGDEAPRQLARAFSRVAWPAFAILVVTGVWNLLEVDVGSADADYLATLAMKLAAVGVSGGAAMVHTAARSRAALAAGGAIGAIAATAALLLGVVLHG